MKGARLTVGVWMRPWVCLKCGEIQMQTEREADPGNCSFWRCGADDVVVAGTWVSLNLPVFQTSMARMDSRYKP